MNAIEELAAEIRRLRKCIAELSGTRKGRDGKAATLCRKPSPGTSGAIGTVRGQQEHLEYQYAGRLLGASHMPAPTNGVQQAGPGCLNALSGRGVDTGLAGAS